MAIDVLINPTSAQAKPAPGIKPATDAASDPAQRFNLPPKESQKAEAQPLGQPEAAHGEGCAHGKTTPDTQDAGLTSQPHVSLELIHLGQAPIELIQLGRPLAGLTPGAAVSGTAVSGAAVSAAAPTTAAVAHAPQSGDALATANVSALNGAASVPAMAAAHLRQPNSGTAQANTAAITGTNSTAASSTASLSASSSIISVANMANAAGGPSGLMYHNQAMPASGSLVGSAFFAAAAGQFPSHGGAAFDSALSGTQLPSSLLPAAQSLDGSSDATATGRPQISQWGPLPLTPGATVPQLARELVQPMREQLRFHLDQRISHAEVRLDPPDMGKIDLSIRLEGDRLHISMHAANNHIRDALQSGLDRLRAELAQDHQGDIQVDVGQQEQGDKRKADTRDGTVLTSAPAQSSNERQQATTTAMPERGLNLLA